MVTTAQQIRDYQGPALLSYGFRPFFLFGALWAVLAVAIWLPLLNERISLPTALTPIQWHVHELLFGFVPSIAAGFLLTAVPNWTGRLPVVGFPLFVLFLIWVAGRAAILASAWIGQPIAAFVDLAFLSLLAIVIAREIIVSDHKRNLKVLVVIVLLLIGNALFHLEVTFDSEGAYGERVGITAIVLLIMLIGGRIIPSFTRNWLVRRPTGRLPLPFGKFDAVAMFVSAAALTSWILSPDSLLTALLAMAAFVGNAGRLVRWAGERVSAEPLVLILHIGYAFVPLGFLLLTLSILGLQYIASAGALHGWTAGAIGVMTLAVMTRATLGHTGQPLRATRAIQFVYAASVVAGLARLIAAFGIVRDPMLQLSAIAWVLAFGGFVVIYGPFLIRRRS